MLRGHWTNGVPLHPVYVPEYHCDGTDGGYLRRFSCRVCVFASDHDIRQTFAHDREAFDLISALEVGTGFTIKVGKSLVQTATAPLQVARDADQLSLFQRSVQFLGLQLVPQVVHSSNVTPHI